MKITIGNGLFLILNSAITKAFAFVCRVLGLALILVGGLIQNSGPLGIGSLTMTIGICSFILIELGKIFLLIRATWFS